MKTLFATPEQVRAFRAGATAFLVPMKPQPDTQSTLKALVDGEFLLERWPKTDRSFSNFGRCDRLNPPYAVGSVVAVKEAWSVGGAWLVDPCLNYRADGIQKPLDPAKLVAAKYRHREGWRAPAQMPPWAVRIHLTITAVAPQLVSEISEADALLCGGIGGKDQSGGLEGTAFAWSAKHLAGELWHSRYGDKFPWAWLCRAEVKL